MAFDISGLRPQIRQILSSPGTDLATISAKRVRRRLLEMEALTPEFMKENKEAVDAVIGSVFEKVQAGQYSGSEDEGGAVAGSRHSPQSSPRKRKTTDELDEDGARRMHHGAQQDGAMSSPAQTKKAKKASSKKSSIELSDAELARQLSSEINSRARRSTTLRSNAMNGLSKKGSRKAKSSEIVESDDDDSGDGDRRGGSKKKSSGGTAKGGFAKEYILSEPLSVVIGADRLSRPQVVKQLWVYIKGNELQNPANKQEILCDGNLRAIFNADKVNMFRMNKVLGQHLHEDEE